MPEKEAPTTEPNRETEAEERNRRSCTELRLPSRTGPAHDISIRNVLTGRRLTRSGRGVHQPATKCGPPNSTHSIRPGTMIPERKSVRHTPLCGIGPLGLGRPAGTFERRRATIAESATVHQKANPRQLALADEPRQGAFCVTKSRASRDVRQDNVAVVQSTEQASHVTDMHVVSGPRATHMVGIEERALEEKDARGPNQLVLDPIAFRRVAAARDQRHLEGVPDLNALLLEFDQLRSGQIQESGLALAPDIKDGADARRDHRIDAKRPREQGAARRTGACGGVGAARTPPEWLAPGRTMTTTIEGLGQLVNTCI